MRIYSTVQLCSITSLRHSVQHLCRAIGRLQVRISLGFWLFLKGTHYEVDYSGQKTAGLQCTLTLSNKQLLRRVSGTRSKKRDRKSELVLRSTYQIFERDRNNSDRNFYNVVRYVHIPLVP